MNSSRLIKIGLTFLIISIVFNILSAVIMLSLKNNIKNHTRVLDNIYYRAELFLENEGYKFDSAAFLAYVADIKDKNDNPENRNYFTWSLCDKSFSEYVRTLGNPTTFEGPDTLAFGNDYKQGWFSIPRFINRPENNQVYYLVSKKLNKSFLRMYRGYWTVSDSVSILAYFIEERGDTISIYGEPSGIFIYE